MHIIIRFPIHTTYRFYTGFGTTAAREIPFAFIQMPIWEFLKVKAAAAQGLDDASKLPAWHGGVCGGIGGAVAAAVTTPLDVVKTRLMTQAASTCATAGAGAQVVKPYEDAMLKTMRRIAQEEGPRALLSGLGPRTFWISTGGFVFFGAYEKARHLLAEAGLGS